MPTITRGLTIVLILAALPRLAPAGGPVQSLPKDGCWVKFHLEYEPGPGDDVKGTGSWTFRSVGTKTVHGEKCRWIEIEEHIDQGDDGKPFTRWFKYLVREKDLKPGGDPLSNLIEYWHKDTFQTKTATKSDNRFTMMPMYFRGTPKMATAVAKPKRVFWQQGNFTIKQAEEQTQTIREQENRYRLIIRDVVWKKADIPFAAALTSSVRLERAGFPTDIYIHMYSLSVAERPRIGYEVEDPGGKVRRVLLRSGGGNSWLALPAELLRAMVQVGNRWANQVARGASLLWEHQAMSCVVDKRFWESLCHLVTFTERPFHE